MRRFWSAREDQILRRFYPDSRTDHLALWLDRKIHAVYQRADVLGLKKTAAYLASEQAQILRRRPEIGEPGRFKPGQIPWNKGIKHPPGWSPGRMKQTQFKKGERNGSAARRWRPVGSTRFSKEGYLERKVSDTGYSPRDYVGEHILLWEKTHGPVPKGYMVCFKDGDKTHIVESNLELISRAERMRRNSVHNLPKELSLVIQLAGALKRKIRETDEKRFGDAV